MTSNIGKDATFALACDGTATFSKPGGGDQAGTWTGSATLTFGASEHEALHHLAPVTVLGGYRTSIAMTITGAEVRPV